MVNSTIYQEVQIKTIMRYHYTSTRMANIWTMMIPKLARIWSNRNSHKLLVGMKNGITTLEDSLLFSYESKHTLTIPSNSCAPWHLPKGTENLHPSRNLHTDIYSSFSHNCQNMEATKMSFSGWMDK